MSLTVTCWNMNHWQRDPESRLGAWKYLKEHIKTDFALVQETVPPTEIDNIIYKEIGGRRKWGSAVVGYGRRLCEVSEIHTIAGAKSLHQSHPGCLVAALTYDNDCKPLMLISMYGMIFNRYAITTVHRLLSDLTPIFDGAIKHRVIMGGDLNLSTQLEPPSRARATTQCAYGA